MFPEMTNEEIESEIQRAFGNIEIAIINIANRVF